MTANKPSDAIPEVMKRRIKELERDGYNEDFLRCFRNAIKQLETLHGLSQLQHESEELGLYQMTHATRVCYVCQQPLEPDDIAASCINGGPRHRKAVNSLRVYSTTTEGGPCRKCGGTGVIDAPTSADDPSCPDCDGEGNAIDR